ncbi:MAG TPA: PAS domain S-box protein [Candidatus Acidoferrales bacterium]|nr:PAS domain S-box protein [Candidatus Acidoferrales bacterium]
MENTISNQVGGADLLHLFLASVHDYAIFTLDLEGRITTWNAGAERAKGYKSSEIIGRHFSCFYPEEDVKNNKPQRLLDEAARNGRVEDEGWRVRKDGTRFWADVVITAVKDDAGNLLGFSKVTRDITERMMARKALEDSRASLRELSLHLLRAQDEERRTIGREMHDSLGQYLSILKMRLDAMTGTDESSTRSTREGLIECSRLAAECVKEVRTVSYLLYPPMLDELGLKSAIPWYLDGFSKRSGISTSFDISRDFERLPREVELVLFRVLQECLTNVHKHSGSSSAKVGLTRSDGVVVLEVADSGAGIPAPVTEEFQRDWTGSLGVGLRGMSERVRHLGGQLSVSTGKVGTQVRAVVPATGAREAKRSKP